MFDFKTKTYQTYNSISLSSNPAYAGNAGPGSVAGGGAASAASNGGVSTIESTKRGHPLKSFSVPGPPPTGGATPVNKHSKLKYRFFFQK